MQTRRERLSSQHFNMANYLSASQTVFHTMGFNDFILTAEVVIVSGLELLKWRL